MRHLATIRTIKEIRPIPKADRIVTAVIDGWECVVSKDDGFKAGDKVIYIEVDSLLPPRKEFEFLKDRKYRVKTIKLRGQISQGLVLPISKFLKGTRGEGEDVTEELGIKKYDPETIQENRIAQLEKSRSSQPFIVRQLMRFEWFKKLATRFRWFIKYADFPSYIKKTDEERIQNLPELFSYMKENKIPLSVTEKIDGTSATFFLDGNRYGICSRKRWLLRPEKEVSWQHSYFEMFQKYNLKKVLKDLRTRFSAHLVVIQGEIIGEGIQKNKYGLNNKYDLKVFNIIIDGQRMGNSTCRKLCVEYGLSMVPVVMDNFVIPDDWEIKDLVDMTKGSSVLRPDNGQREGLVFRNETEGISFKAINPLFLLKEN